MYSDKYSKEKNYRKRSLSNTSDKEHSPDRRYRHIKRESRSRSRSRSSIRGSSKYKSSHKRKSHRSRSRESKRSKIHERKRSKSPSRKKQKKENNSNIKLEKNPSDSVESKEVIDDVPDKVYPIDYNSDEFIEMPPMHKKKSKKQFSTKKEVKDEPKIENELQVATEIDPLDEFMTKIKKQCDKIKYSAIKKPNNATGMEPTADKEEAFENQMDFLAEPETLESLTQAYMEEKRQKLPEVDHNKTYYRQYNYNLYKEVPSVSKLSNKDVKIQRKKLEVSVRGKDCPRPISRWSHAVVKKQILQALHYNKMETPTPIQCQTIPAIMSGRDVIGVAKTGSGKTLAYLLPLIRHISIQDAVQICEGPIAVVLCPTRELCIQIYQEVEKVTQFAKNIRCGCIYGGADTAQQIARLKRGVEILVATPGRMIDIMSTNSGRNLSLARVTFIVLDEADRMFDMGFEPQVLAIVQRVRPQRQIVMFSATFPRKIEGLARKFMQEPLEIRAGGGNKVCNDVLQHVKLLKDEDKFMQLLEVLGQYEDHGKILVFVERQETAVQVSNNVNHQNYRNLVLHGGMAQDKREQAIHEFRHGNVWILIATSVAARGLDVNELVCVVNYDCPSHYEDYVHRCGRTGRAGNKGDAFTFVTPDQEVMIMWLVKALKESSQAIPKPLSDALEQYNARMKLEGRAIKAPSGFRGHGFKFDAAEAMREKERRLVQLQKLCPDEITEEEEAILKELSGGGDTAPGPEASEEGTTSSIMEAHTHARTAHQIAARLSQRIDTAISKNPDLAPTKDPSQQFHETMRKEIAINCYPAHVRYLLATKELRTSLSENYDVSCSVKGEFVLPRKLPGTPQEQLMNSSGPRPLHLLLEADSMISINAAEKEIIRLVKEGLNSKL